MKQTNNAIKFLMAQYRAIFQNAYFKGLATAAVVTMGLAAGQAQAADFANNPLAGTDEITWDESKKAADTSLSGTGESQWNAPLKVTNQGSDTQNYKIAANGGDLTLAGSGSLTVETSDASHGISLESAAAGALTVDISAINVKAGLLDIKGNASKAATVVADEITIGAKPADPVGRASPVEAKIILNAATDKFKAELGDINSSVKLYEHGTIEFNGSGADFAILNGNLDGSNGGTLSFSGNGTVKAYSTEAIKTNITVEAGKTASIKLGDNEAGKQTLSLGEGSKITLNGTAANLTVDSGSTLELADSVVLTNTTAEKGVLSVAETATLQANTSIIKSFMAEDGETADKKGNVTLNGTWILTGENNDLGGIAIGDGNTTAGQLNAGANSLIKGTDVAVSTAITTGTNINIEAETLTLGKSDAASAALLGAGKAKAKDLVLLTNEETGFNLDDNITLTAVSGTTDKTADNVTLEEKIVLNKDQKGLTIKGGNYTAESVVAGSGSLSIAKHDEVNSTLKINTLVLDNTLSQNDNGKIAVTGADATTDLDKVVLDLSETNISYKAADSSAAKTSVKLDADKATIKISGDSLKALVSDVATDYKGTIFDVKNSGQLLVSSDFTLDASSQLKQTGVTNNGIQLTQGTLAVDGALTLTNAATVNLGKADGKNILKAKTLDLQVATPATEASTLQSGNFVVSEGLKTNSQTGVVVGAKGKLQLNDEAGSSRTVYANLVNVSGDTATLDAVKGTWTLTDLSLGTTGVANVNSGAGLNVTKLTATDAGSKFNVADGATATVEQISANNADQINVSGVVTVAGKIAQEGKNPPTSYGVDLAAKSVKMEQTGKLSFGDAATQSIKVNKDGIEVLAESFKAGAIKSVAGSEVSFSFDETTNFTAEALKDLRTKIFGSVDGALVDGRINLGKATIAGIDENIVDNKISWDKVEGLSDAIGDSTSEKLSQAIVTDVTSADKIRGHYGAIQSKDTGSINIVGNTSLNNAAANNGMFAQGIDQQPSDFNVATGTLELNNGGTAGSVNLSENTTLQVNGSQTTIEAIDGKKASVVLAQGATTVTNNASIKNFTDVANSSLTVGKKLTLGEGLAADQKTTILGSVKAGSAEFKADALVKGNLQVTAGNLVASKTFEASGNLTVSGASTFKGKATLSGAQNNLGVVTFEAAGNKIAQGQTFASDIKLGNNAIDLVVGTDPTDALPAGASAYLVTDKLTLNDGDLYIDPSYNVASSIVIANELSNADPATLKTDAGSLGGSVVALQNSIFAVGLDTTDKAAALASVKSELAPLFKSNGALDKDNVGSVAYIAKKITLGATDQLVVDSSKSLTAFNNADQAYKDIVTTNDIVLGANSALAVDGSAFGNGKAAITLQDGSKIFAGEGSKVILTGKDAMNADGNKLFGVTGAGSAGLTLNAAGTTPTLRVETINGWFYQDLTSTNLTNALDLDIDKTKADKDLEVVSEPVRDTLLSAAYGIHNYDEYLAKKTDGTWDDATMAQDVLGEVAPSSFKYDVDQGKFFEGAVELTDAEAEKKGIDVESSKKYGVVYLDATNALLENILFSNGSAVDAETNARLAVFGGAPQAAIEAGASTYEAISARMGVGVSGVSAAANGQGGAIWVTPVYKSADADGFNADNKSYGADVKLYGLALGADIEVAPNFKVGGMFNVGSGDADGQGLGSNVSNDFDYYGLGLYAGYSMDAFSLVADVTYTAVDNDIEGNTDLGKVNASIDSTNLSVGVTGQYKLSLAGMDVTPHAGLRYSMIDMDDYSTAYSQNDSDSINIFSVPVGVTIAKEYVTDTWTVKPSFDLTLTGNFGDDEAEATAKWNGFSNLSTTVKSEIMDNFTYGAAVGVSATSGNFGLGLGVNYTGSSNTDEFGVNANARYMF